MSIVMSKEVQDAIHYGQPVVGLESSNVTGGTYPSNFEMANTIDHTIRSQGAVPARIAVIEGKLHIGTSQATLERLSEAPDVEKVGNRELGIALARGQTAGTTVSASLIPAAQVGLRVFGVAGIGGVHRGAEISYDISADLPQMLHSPLMVVCAGAKSLLDPRLTLEWMETHGIPVIGYRSDEFPGYLAETTGEPVPVRSNSVEEIVTIARHHWENVGNSSVVVTSPIKSVPGIDSRELNTLINEALRSAEKAGAGGKELTPFVLRALSQATQGQSSQVNRAVLLDTVSLAAEVAVSAAQGFRLEDGSDR